MDDCWLVSVAGHWFSCRESYEVHEGRRAIVWRRTFDDTFVCRVGEEDETQPLPGSVPVRIEVTRDSFNNLIYEVDEADNIIDLIGGANNAIAARAAFRSLVQQSSGNRRLSLRHGAHEIGAAIGNVETI